MSNLIINAPHLQSFQQRFGSYIVAVTCWLLWLYFLVPIITLGGWLLGVRQLSKEIRWFGGYKSLLELMQLYGEAILAIVALWLCWSLITSLRRATPGPQPQAVSNAELCQAYAVDLTELERCQDAQRITVHFDDHGHIVHMEPEAAEHSVAQSS